MICEKTLTIQNKLGLHARAAAQLVKTANSFTSEVSITKNKVKANGKSILGVLTLAASFGSLITVSCNGPDAEDALAAIDALVEAKFNEE